MSHRTNDKYKTSPTSHQNAEVPRDTPSWMEEARYITHTPLRTGKHAMHPGRRRVQAGTSGYIWKQYNNGDLSEEVELPL